MTPLWKPSQDRIQNSNLFKFVSLVSQREGSCEFHRYEDLHRWSIDRPDRFWRSVWDFSEIKGEPGDIVFQGAESILDAKWFPQGSLNFADNLLPSGSCDDSIAIIATDETGAVENITFRELRLQAIGFANYLLSRGVNVGDRVAGLLPNTPSAVIAMLGTVAIGAVWSCCSPDFGADAIIDRFGQIAPKVLVTQSTCQYNGKKLQLLDKIERVLRSLPTVESIVLCGPDVARTEANGLSSRDATSLKTICELHSHQPFEFRLFPFSHPIYILYSSGTTGAPKCIVHSAGGTLLQHAKELWLHADLHAGDRLFYYTTTGWMMWNWLVSGLQARATIVLYDGGPLYPNASALFELAAKHRFTHFGASAKFFSAVQKEGCIPRDIDSFDALRTVLSTGSPLLAESFDFIYEQFKGDVHLASISGGTDIVSCFVLGVPTEPVYRGQIQAPGLGMNIQILDDDGRVLHGEAGELVCASPFPSMPIGFWNDPDRSKYFRSYFDRFPNIWCHGDWAQRTDQGGFVIFGRSDATLNPGGVRIGTAEIYRQVEAFEEVAESLATVIRKDGDEQIMLFVKMKPDHPLQPSLVDQIKKRLREHCSPRHVPAYILEALDLPRTISGKLSELAVRNAINGMPIKNEGALANPESLDFFRGIPLNYRLQKEV